MHPAGVLLIHRGDLSCSPRSCFHSQPCKTEQVPDTPQVTAYNMHLLASAKNFPRSAFKCNLVPLFPSLAHPTSPLLIIRQAGTRCFVIRRSQNLGEAGPPELDCLCRRRENLCFHFQSLSFHLSHPQITAAPVQCTYVTRSRLLLADRGLYFNAPVGST